MSDSSIKIKKGQIADDFISEAMQEQLNRMAAKDEANTFTASQRVDTNLSVGGTGVFEQSLQALQAPVQPNDVVRKTELDTKQPTLVSGANVKTVNGSSLLGSGNLAVGDVNQGGNTVTSAMSVGTINDFDFLIKRNNITQVTVSSGNINISSTLTLTGTGNVLTLPLGSTINGASGNGGYITIATATTPMVYGKNGTGVGHQFRVSASHASDIATFTKATSIVSGVRQDGSFYTAGDVEITDATKGVILKSPNGTRYRVTVSDTGVLTTTAI